MRTSPPDSHGTLPASPHTGAPPAEAHHHALTLVRFDALLHSQICKTRSSQRRRLRANRELAQQEKPNRPKDNTEPAGHDGKNKRQETEACDDCARRMVYFAARDGPHEGNEATAGNFQPLGNVTATMTETLPNPRARHGCCRAVPLSRRLRHLIRPHIVFLMIFHTTTCPSSSGPDCIWQSFSLHNVFQPQ